ncbi:MAG: hypothetical protein M3301_08605 [Chloroflexota bacterium]|nr:hypothetical protein [Chloroflexota bacterium]
MTAGDRREIGVTGGSTDVPGRSWLAVRWRQLRNPPPPVLRAVLANLVVAVAAAVPLLGYDVALTSGPRTSRPTLPGGDLRPLAFTAYVVGVALAGSLLTYLWVLLPTGASGLRRRSGWSAMLGFFASLPVAYLVLVVAFQVVRPLLE